MLGQLRTSVEPFKANVARPLIFLGISPIAVSLAGLVLGLLVVFATLSNHTGWAFLLALMASSTDFLDGAVARGSGQVSKTGDFLEAVIDKMVEVILLLGLSFQNPQLCFLAASSAFLVSYIKPRLAQVIPIDNHDWPGAGDHADRIVMILFSYLFRALQWTAWLPLTLLVICSLIGVIQRLRYAQQLIHQASAQSAERHEGNHIGSATDH
jgi:phosphatidylglycerophosphate synthase